MIPIQHRLENALVADTEYLKFQHLSALLIASGYFGIESIDYRRWFVKFSRQSSLVHATRSTISSLGGWKRNFTNVATLRLCPKGVYASLLFPAIFSPLHPFELNGKRKFESRGRLFNEQDVNERGKRSNATTRMQRSSCLVGIQKSLSPGV